MRKYFPQQETAKQVSSSLKPREQFKPFDTLPHEERARAALLYVDCTPDATPREIAYQEMKMVREFWPVEA
jgi:hypothetical protein